MTLVGRWFQPGAAVAFGGVAASSVTVADDGTSLTASSPAWVLAPGHVDLVVANPDGKSVALAAAFAYLPAPTVNAMLPSSGLSGGGTRVTILGENLGALRSVTFGGVPASIVGATSTSIAVETPPGFAGQSATVVVTTAGGSLALPVPFRYLTSGDLALTATAAASATAAVEATVTLAASSRLATATAVAAEAGNSPASAIALAVGGDATDQFSFAGDQSWYGFAATAGQSYELVTESVGSPVDTVLALWRYEWGALRLVAFSDDEPAPGRAPFSAVAWAAPATETLYAQVRHADPAAFGSSTTHRLRVRIAATALPSPTPRPPTATPTRTGTPLPTPTATRLAAPDDYEDDPVYSRAIVWPVGAPQSRTVHRANDVDHTGFSAASSGRYVVRTFDLTGGVDTVITLLDADGAVVQDALGVSLRNDDDPTPVSSAADLGRSRLVFDVAPSQAGRDYVVQVRNRNGHAFGPGVGYRLRVVGPTPLATPSPTATSLGPTATPTPLPTVTPTSTSTPTPASDAYDPADDSRAAADARGPYALKQPLAHDGLAAPRHNFSREGDEDWLALRLGALLPGSRLTIRTADLGRRDGSGLQTDTLLYLYRPDATAFSGLRLLAFNNLCPGAPVGGGSCLVWSFSDADALLHSGETWYARVRNFDPTFHGADATYSIHVALDPPDEADPPLPSPTPISAAEGALLRVGSTTVDLPPGFTTGSDRAQVHVAEGPGALQLGAGTATLRTFTAKVIAADSGERLREFDLEIGLCVTFTYAEVQNLDQSDLRPYWIDPATGARRTDGLTLTRLTPAAPGSPGTLCFKTTHFTAFELAAPMLPTPTFTAVSTATARSAATATPAPGALTPTPAAATPAAATPAAATPTATRPTATRFGAVTSTPTRGPLQDATATPTATSAPPETPAATASPGAGTSVAATPSDPRLLIPAVLRRWGVGW